MEHSVMEVRRTVGDAEVERVVAEVVVAEVAVAEVAVAEVMDKETNKLTLPRTNPT